MKTARYIFWQEDGLWLGFLEEYPDYTTQGESLADLQDHLRDIHKDLANGAIPNVRRVGELEIA